MAFITGNGARLPSTLTINLVQILWAVPLGDFVETINQQISRIEGYELLSFRVWLMLFEMA